MSHLGCFFNSALNFPVSSHCSNTQKTTGPLAYIGHFQHSL